MLNKDQLARWVMDNVHPGDRWRWTPKVGRPVVMVIHSIGVPLPDWFVGAMSRRTARRAPWHMDCDRFSHLVNSGALILSGREQLPQ